MSTPEKLKEAVRSSYGAIARGEQTGCDVAKSARSDDSSCCGPSCWDSSSPSEGWGYGEGELGTLPEGADLGLGCGNPGAIAALEPGETVLDLGSGAGIDCFLAARKVGPTGHVIGVDMTPDMITLANKNARDANVTNVEIVGAPVVRVDHVEPRQQPTHAVPEHIRLRGGVVGLA